MFKMNMKDNFEAQAWAMLWGLKFSWELGLRHVVVESDCGDLVDLVGNSVMQEDEQKKMSNYKWYKKLRVMLKRE